MRKKKLYRCGFVTEMLINPYQRNKNLNQNKIKLYENNGYSGGCADRQCNYYEWEW